jgi:hypothetical protein
MPVTIAEALRLAAASELLLTTLSSRGRFTVLSSGARAAL